MFPIDQMTGQYNVCVCMYISDTAIAFVDLHKILSSNDKSLQAH